MPVASRQSAGLLMYRSYTGAPPGRGSSSAGVCMSPGGATVPARYFPLPSRLFPLPRRSLPVLYGDSRFIPEVLNILILSRWSPGSSRWSPGSSRLSPGIIVGLRLK
ncbi:hypothetical protein DPMN_110299 [Dreissena polymorpha]|uniref:Uncharacterized protein n=1 Tax=Dreissena polymorpha TaxID=45954 RepID=A0A9D4QMX2_DREPO|nr:hypothetical protein DPMN_110299 [Dreissena polymorpha]